MWLHAGRGSLLLEPALGLLDVVENGVGLARGQDIDHGLNDLRALVNIDTVRGRF